MSADSPGSRYWKLIEPYWLPLNASWDDDPQPFLQQFRRVPGPVGHLYAAHWCQSEVCNGGLKQFFFNTTGLLAPEALDGFRAIGVKEWAAVLAEAIAYFGPDYPRRRTLRLQSAPTLDYQNARTSELFVKLDDRFDDWLEVDSVRWARAADAYAARVG